MFDALLKRLTGETSENNKPLSEEELRVATAALLVHAIKIDDEVQQSEEATVAQLLKGHFDLSTEECAEVMASAKAKESEAVDLYSFTRVLTRQLDQPGRQAIIELLWKAVYADEELHAYEENLVWRVAELLGVSTADRIRLKKSVSGEV